MLKVENINVFYGDLQVLGGVSFEVREGEILVLVGANGAGKSTTLKTISGILKPKIGSITFKGNRLDTMPADKVISPAGVPAAGAGRGPLCHPTLLMFAGPSLGLAPILVEEVFNIVKKINGEGVTVLLVEQNVRQTLALCPRAYVLENGRVVLQRTGKELLNDEHAKEASLGI